jgi:insulin-like growth factor 2 mRNA-binding protein 1
MAPTTALQEKVITIRGQPENCINACREILKVMKADAESKSKPSDTPLKVLAHNDYIGRIIGKQGTIINTIKNETETSVTVSSINDMSMNVERVITVKGDLENMIKALEIIHSKVKSAFENDTKTYGAQAIMMGGIPPIPLAPPAFGSAAAAAAAAAFNAGPSSAARFAAAAAAAAAQAQQHGHIANGHHNPHQQANGAQSATHSGASNGSQSNQFQNFYPPIYPAHPGHPHQMPQYQGQNMLQQQQATQSAQGSSQQGSQQNLGQSQEFINQGPEPETVYLYIPNVAVGAIIGTKGSFIKNIIKLSGASVKITPLTPEESKNVVERQVVIVGTPDSQWKAQYYIYEKIRQERFATDENVKLRAELQVPAHIVGRIIGKSGKNVRELQRNTGATIKLPEDAALLQQQTGDSTGENADETDETQKSSEAEITEATAPAPVVADVPVAELVLETATSTATAGEEDNKVVEPEAPGATTPQQQQAPAGFVVVRIFGTFQASQLAQRRIQGLVMQSVRGSYSVDNQMIMSHRNSLNNITNHQFQMPMMMGSFQPRADFQPGQSRMNGGNNYNNNNNNRRNNRHHQQKSDQSNKLNGEQQKDAKDMNGIVQQQQQPIVTNGVSEEPSSEQLSQLNINKQETTTAATPITA